METLRVGLSLFAGLALFLYGMMLMSHGIEQLSEAKVRRILEHCTKSVFLGVVTGAAATVLLDSSSVVIILLIGIVNARLMSLEQAMGVIMGANVGTTMSTQIFALQIEELAPVGLIAGFLMQSLSKSPRVKQVGTLILGLGLVFFGLSHMSQATAPFRDHPAVIAYVRELENPLKGALAGAAITAVIQSSSAMMGIAVSLAVSGTMTLPAAVALMFGAEIGTCADTLLASVGRSREAVRAGVFNVASVALGLMFAAQFVWLVRQIAGGATIAQQIATAHVMFNVMGVLLFAWLTKPFAQLVRRLVPDRVGVPASDIGARQMEELTPTR